MNTCPAELNFASHLAALNAARAAKPAYIDDSRQLSYGELAERVARMAGALRQLGLRREERILLLMQDTVDWPVAFLGALHAGVVPVAVNTLLTPDDYAYIITHSRVRAVFVSGALMPALQAALAQSPGDVEHVVVSQPNNAQPKPAQPNNAQPKPAHPAATLPAPAQDFDALLAGAPLAPAVRTLSDEIAFWLYSSGSTGKPKGVVHTHGNLWHTAELYAKPVLGIREDDVVFSAAKLFFAYGLGNGLTFPLSVGATVILMGERPTPQAVFQRLTRHRPTVFYGVPTLYASMLASPDLPPREQVAMRVCTSAGEALPRDIGERFTRHFGCEILDGIGSTEMLHIFISNQSGQIRYGTTGKPVPGYEVQLRDDSGAPVAAGTIGDLYIKGPSAALMYWNNRDKTRQCFLGDWLKSGDKYTCDTDGYYTYAGRSDDMIKVSGQYVSPVEVENVLVQHEAVLEAAVIGVPDHDGLVKTKAYVVLRPGFEPDAQTGAALQSYVKQHLAPFKYPRQINFTEELPKTATGKIQRFRLRQLEEATL
ncbi:Benzoate--CoA ligase [Achromobacter spanius]|uniref:benzoate-CoA ligase family protein n=1 Tax=Achromobacter spanius TaxID=217203 RepID=UPI000C2C13D5|nr:benzoate-CoA ligase family protein [Achromobacter spanius]AUA56955.1 benzoate-CoA ligase family protein [Achromobacter spanius]CAB3687814.1 Benzoate--CoA ligase [Achromobacter spanius]SPT40011.1 Benzoate--CoA ligase [Achromobacter denitrificans]VEE55397.1 Benzoate--CoA ligase [Achromobacter spanius]